MSKTYKFRDYHAVHFRRSGPMLDRKKEDDRRSCRKKPDYSMYAYCDFCGEYGLLVTYYNNNEVFYVCKNSKECDDKTFWDKPAEK